MNDIREKREAAQEQLQKAIENILDVYECHGDGSILSGWVLCVAGGKFQTKDDETYEEGDSELETLAKHTMFFLDGQHPYMSRGIVERALDRLKE